MFRSFCSLVVKVLTVAFILLCVSPSVGQITSCGDGVCAFSLGENCSTCAKDCCPNCGDGYCYLGSNFTKENVTNCPADCAPTCGDGICGQSPPPGYPAETSMNCAKDCAPICGDKVCTKVPLSNYSSETYVNCPQDCIAVCGNGVCDSPDEDAIECPSDCSSISFDGVLLEAWPCREKTMCSSWFKKATLNISNLEDFANGSPIASGKITGYIRTKGRGDYELLLSTASIGSKVFINGILVIDAYYVADKEVKLVQKVTLPDRYIHSIVIEIYPYGNNYKAISLLWRLMGDSTVPFKDIESVFFSKNVCGDLILDTNEICSADSANTKTTQYTPEKGICLEDDPNKHFTDCFSHITDTCSQISLFADSSSIKHDSLGNLMQNQMLWRLPGSEIMTFGVDVITGEPSLSPLFYFSYCNASTLQVVQDTYRGNTYIIPPELHAQSSPKCSFSMVSNTYSSSSEMSNEMAQNSGVSASASAEGGWGEINGKVSAAYSKEKSVEQAKSLESKQSGSLISTEVGCETSKVKMTKNTFHPSFLEDLAQARTSDDYLKLVKRYGTHYYKRATLGGKLKQITAMSKTLSKSKTEQEQSQSAQRSFGASISSPVFSVSGDYSDSSDSSVKGSDQQEFENQSSRSTVITYGGPPGSFGPSTSDAPSNFGDWASNIDLLPVPIDYELESITSIIPDEWKLPDGTSIKSMWNQSALEYEYSLDIASSSKVNGVPYSVVIMMPRRCDGAVEYECSPTSSAPASQLYLTANGANRTIFQSDSSSGIYAPIIISPATVFSYFQPFLFSFLLNTNESNFDFNVTNVPCGLCFLWDTQFWIVNELTNDAFVYHYKVVSATSAAKEIVNATGNIQLYLELYCDELCDATGDGTGYMMEINFLEGHHSQWIPFDQWTVPSTNKKGVLTKSFSHNSGDITKVALGIRTRNPATPFRSTIYVSRLILFQSMLQPNSTIRYQYARRQDPVSRVPIKGSGQPLVLINLN